MSHEPCFDKGWLPLKMLDHWIKSNYKIEIYTSMGSKVTGVIKGYDNFNLTLINDENLKVIVFKGNIFYIVRIKDGTR